MKQKDYEIARQLKERLSACESDSEKHPGRGGAGMTDNDALHQYRFVQAEETLADAEKMLGGGFSPRSIIGRCGGVCSLGKRVS